MGDRVFGDAVDRQRAWQRGETDWCCDGCGEVVLFRQLIVSILFCFPQLNEYQRVEYKPICREGGAPLVEHLLMHHDCYEELYLEVKSSQADEPPVTCDDELIDCLLCHASIEGSEAMAAVQKGRFDVGRLEQVNFLPEKDHDRVLEPNALCIICLRELAGVIGDPDWSALSESGECARCTRARCWRKVRCSCTCHEEMNHGIED